jgi:hypothetical protein
MAGFPFGLLKKLRDDFAHGNVFRRANERIAATAHQLGLEQRIPLSVSAAMPIARH